MPSDLNWADFDSPSSSSGGWGPSTAQLDFLADLGVELGVDLCEEATDAVGWHVTDLRSLSREEASELISSLKGRRGRDGRQY